MEHAVQLISIFSAAMAVSFGAIGRALRCGVRLRSGLWQWREVCPRRP